MVLSKAFTINNKMYDLITAELYDCGFGKDSL